MARLKLGTGRINITDGGGTHVRSRFVSRRAERDGRIFRRRLFSCDDAAAENENVLLETVQIGSGIFFFVSCLLRASHREQTSFTALGHVPSTERVPVSGVSESRDVMNLTLWRTTRPARFLFFPFSFGNAHQVLREGFKDLSLFDECASETVGLRFFFETLTFGVLNVGVAGEQQRPFEGGRH